MIFCVDRINIMASGPVPMVLLSKNSDGRGRTGDIKVGWCFGRSTYVTIGGTSIELNQGSTIDFIQAHQSLLPPHPLPPLVKGGLFSKGSDDKEIQQYLDLVIRCLTPAPLDKFTHDSWALAQGKADFAAGNALATLIHLRKLKDSTSLYMRGASCLKLNRNDEGEKLLQKAIKLGNIPALVELGNYYYEQKKYDEAFTNYKAAADRNSAEGCLGAAKCYKKGRGVSQSPDDQQLMQKKAKDLFSTVS